MPTTASLHRDPLKGLSGQSLTSCAVEAGRPFGNDRVFARVRPDAPIELAAPAWGK